ncbi:hypothetical protein JTB14_030871 [Gonioctena quinquepunctata]|nr:hypothetical protein JTB14_030871 [Gonioctena quinquepunctata]
MTYMCYLGFCLPNSNSKVYEGLLRKRLEKDSEEKGLSDRQFGFRKGKSTIQVVESVVNIPRGRANNKWAVLITLAVRNAFNTASWDRIMLGLETRGIQDYLLETIDNYLDDRFIQIKENVCLEVTAGVPQGLILGPSLWNILYDGGPDESVPEEVTTLAYADDLTSVRYGHDHGSN